MHRHSNDRLLLGLFGQQLADVRTHPLVLEHRLVVFLLVAAAATPIALCCTSIGCSACHRDVPDCLMLLLLFLFPQMSPFGKLAAGAVAALLKPISLALARQRASYSTTADNPCPSSSCPWLLAAIASLSPTAQSSTQGSFCVRKVGILVPYLGYSMVFLPQRASLRWQTNSSLFRLCSNSTGGKVDTEGALGRSQCCNGDFKQVETYRV